MNRCIAVVSDLIFATRITGTAAKLGAKCVVVHDLPTLQESIEEQAPASVLVDMHCEGIVPVEALRCVKAACPDARVVAFFSHVQTELMAQAEAAGADEALPRSTFVRRLPELLAPADRARES